MHLPSRFSTLAALCAALLLSAESALALTEAPSERPAEAATSPSTSERGSPSKGLSPEEVYAVLVAEVAGRRGDMAAAFTHYYRAAELTRSAQMAELAVRAAISGEDLASADRGIRLWMDIAPSSPSVYQVAAFVRIKADDPEGALAHLRRLVDLSSADGESPFAKAAAIVTRLSSPEARVSLMSDLVAYYPDNADAQHSLAMVAASASQLEVADKAARRAMELRPGWSAPRLFLVRLLISEGKRPEARRLLEEFVRESPEDQPLRMLYGQFLVEEEEFTTARDVFQRLLTNQPKEPDVLFAVGILSLQLEDLDGAKAYFKRLYDTGERQDEAAFYLGQTLERAKDVPAALGWYDKVGGASSDDAQVRIAFLRAKEGDTARAREILARLRSGSPENAVPLFMVEAEILDDVGRPEEAMSAYDAALAAHPDDASLLYSRGLYAIKRGRFEEGERDLRKIIDEDPNHADALNALGYTLADRTDRLEEARDLIERAIAIKPDEPAILDSMGWVNFRLGHLDEALRYLQKALDQLNDGEIAAHLGEVLWALGRRAEAWAVWDKALQDNPEHEYLQAVVGRYRVSRSDSGSESSGGEPGPQTGGRK